MSIIRTAKGLQIGNLIKNSQSDHWVPEAKGKIFALTIDELIDIDVISAKKGIYEYVDLNNDILVALGFYVDKAKAHIKYNDMGNIFQLNILNQYAGVTDQNSAQIEAAITNGAIPLWRYEFTWGATHIRHAHHLQNLFSGLCGKDLVWSAKDIVLNVDAQEDISESHSASKP